MPVRPGRVTFHQWSLLCLIGARLDEARRWQALAKSSPAARRDRASRLRLAEICRRRAAELRKALRADRVYAALRDDESDERP